jgi:DNA-binding response OmpR family regulator
MQNTIMVVEDEVSISKVLRVYLERAEYQVIQAYDGHEAIRLFDEHRPLLVLLDVMLPGLDGWEVLSHIRQQSACPVIMLTALGDTAYKLKGLHAGADDYLAKPFVNDEVVARVKAVLRRSPNVIEKDQYKVFGSLKIDLQAHQVMLFGAVVEMNPRDLALLLFLTEYPNRTFTRDQLLEHVWGMDYDGSDRAVDLSVKRIRQLLQNWPAEEGEIKTLRGLGYQFCV